jgi:GNAT superfamily N-acetyltransferase
MITPSTNEALIREMQATCLPNAPRYPFEDAYWWIVEEDGQCVAFAGYSPSKQWADTIYLCRSGVIPEAQGRGLQKKLIRARLRHAKKNGARWAITDTRHNPASANSLIACGFRMYTPKHPWSFADACYWIKAL